MSNAFEILDKHEYRVVVTNIDQEGCLVTVPRRIEEPILEFDQIQYQYTPNDIINVFYLSSDGDVLSHKTIDCPTYAQRLWMTYHVVLLCSYIHYSIEAVKYVVDGEAQESEVHFHNAHSNEYVDEEGKLKESRLMMHMTKCMQSDDMYVPDDEDIADGFLAIHQLLVSGEEE